MSDQELDSMWHMSRPYFRAAVREAVAAQTRELRQALWDIRKELGFDNAGDETPIAVVGDLGKMVIDNAIEFRRDSEEALRTETKVLVDALRPFASFGITLNDCAIAARLVAEFDAAQQKGT